MDVKDFYYDLPKELIAQDPLEDRSSSRLLVLGRTKDDISHHVFKEIKEYLKAGDCLVLNNTKVIPARLYGVKEGTEAKIEILLLKRMENDVQPELKFFGQIKLFQLFEELEVRNQFTQNYYYNN